MSHFSLKKQLWKRIISLLIIGILIIGIISSYLFYEVQLNNTKEMFKQRNKNITYFISSYFSKFYNIIDTLSTRKEIIYAPWLDKKEREKALEDMLLFQLAIPDLKYVYIGYKNKELLINNYIPPKNFDPTVRPWYRAALRTAPNPSSGILYREIKSKELLFSVSKVLLDKNGSITGVISIDTPIHDIEELLKENFGYFKSSRAFIIKKSDNSVIVFDTKSLPYLDIIKEKILKSHSNKKYNEFNFNYKGKHLLVYFAFIKRLNWYIVMTVDKNEILYPIITNISILIIIFIIYVLIIGNMAGDIINKGVIKPINSLLKRVEEIHRGFNKSLQDYTYPDNEIGDIFLKIEALTEKELYKKNQELEKAYKKYHMLSIKDPLTGLYNRRKMMEELKRVIEEAKRYKSKFSLIFFDIDFFKQINDTYGHDVGDSVLITLSNIAKKASRKTDIVARWGGEEFLILCPNIEVNSAYKLAERLRYEVERYNFPNNLHITISIGVTEFNEEDTITQLLKRVDDKLYEAKKKGRNRVEL